MPAASPAFSFYASDMMADKRYRCMTLAQRGLLISMYCECWVNSSITSIPAELSKVLGYSLAEIENCLTESLKSYFIDKSNEFSSPEIDKYKEKILNNRLKLSTNGRSGGIKTQQKNRERLEIANSTLASSQPSTLAKAPRTDRNGIEMKRQEQSLVTGDNKSFVEEIIEYERTKG